jgi:hypothetical protein
MRDHGLQDQDDADQSGGSERPDKSRSSDAPDGGEASGKEPVASTEPQPDAWLRLFGSWSSAARLEHSFPWKRRRRTSWRLLSGKARRSGPQHAARLRPLTLGWRLFPQWS